MFQMIAEERAPMIKQPEVGATYDAFLNKPEVGSFLLLLIIVMSLLVLAITLELYCVDLSPP